MGWFKRKLAKIVQDGIREENERKYGTCSNVEAPVREGDDAGAFSQRPLNIQILNATGGKIIRFHRYDDNVHRTEESLYLVNENEDFDKMLTQYITVEAMKR